MSPESRSASMSETEDITAQSQPGVPSPKCSGDPCGRQVSLNPVSLHGKHILVTRTREQAHALSERLQALGAIPVEFPTIRIVPPQNWEHLDLALGKLFLADANN